MFPLTHEQLVVWDNFYFAFSYLRQLSFLFIPDKSFTFEKQLIETLKHVVGT